MIIKLKIKSNNKLLGLYFKMHKTDNELLISIAPNQNINYMDTFEIPCVNISNAIYLMKVIFPLKFNIINFMKKKYIINSRIIEFMFTSQNILLDFLHSFIDTQLQFSFLV